MAIGPMDIHHKEFGTVRVGGYNKEEVDSFLDMVADELERLLHRNQEQAELVESMRQKASQFDSMQQTLQNAIINAQKSADNIVQEARSQAEAMLREAKEQSLRMLEEARAERSRVSQSFADVRGQVMAYIAAFRELLERNQAMIKDYEAKLATAELKEEIAEPMAAQTAVSYPQAEPAIMSGETPQAIEPEAAALPDVAQVYEMPAEVHRPEALTTPVPDFGRPQPPTQPAEPAVLAQPETPPSEPVVAPPQAVEPPTTFRETEPPSLPDEFIGPQEGPRMDEAAMPASMPQPQRPLMSPEEEMELMRRSMAKEAAPPQPPPPPEEPGAGEKHFFWE